ASSPATPQIEAAKTATPTDGVIDAELEDLRRKLNDL
ncbi:MAG: PspA/IM30 family protein, partial [Snowella sp.]